MTLNFSSCTSKSEVHVCCTYFQLFLAVASLQKTSQPNKIVVYLQDSFPINLAQQRQIASQFENIEFHFTFDREAIGVFQNLPKIFPSFLSRNIRVDFPPSRMFPKSFVNMPNKHALLDQVVLYNPSFFVAKAISKWAKQVTLREAGWNSYFPYKVSGIKSLVRLCLGYSPTRQFLGEEKWINQIEVPNIELLPEFLKQKANSIAYKELIEELKGEQIQKFVAVFAQIEPIATAGKRTALLVTQPLDKIGICSAREMVALYQNITDQLTDKGYCVVQKNHPRGDDFELANTIKISSQFPIEFWAYTNLPEIDLAVSLSSFALVNSSILPFKKVKQLVDPSKFYMEYFSDWNISIE